MTNRRSSFALGLVPMLLLGLAPASAQADETDSQLASLFDRPALFDGPGTTRQALRDQGIDIKASWTQFFQGVIDGGASNDWETGGKGDLLINLDGEKLGLWSGFYVNIHQEVIAGNELNALKNGAFLPVNTALAFPRLGGYDYDTSFIFTQVLTPEVTLSAGKFNMLDAAAKTPLLGGGGIDTFMNLGIAAPLSGITPPYLVGASLGVNTRPVSFNFFVYDPRNAQAWDVVTHPFEEGVTLSLSSTLYTPIAGLPGFYSVRGAISTQEGIDLGDVPQIILPPDFPVEIGTKSGRWFVSFSGQQYLWQNPVDPSKGWGLFGQVGLSDGNPNPVQSSVFVGIGGDSMIPGRTDDRWGIAYFRYNWSDDLRDAISEPPFNIAIGPEEGVEAYYNFAVTPWFRVTGNLQWIDDLTVQSDDAWFAGFRVQVKL